jgi:hypothetical protein
MATFENVPIIPVNAKQRNRELGEHIYDGKRAINGVYFGTPGIPYYSSWIHVGGAGDIAFEQKDGNVGVILSVLAGTWIRLVARRILVSGTPNDGGGLVTTTATLITYHGGT